MTETPKAPYRILSETRLLLTQLEHELGPLELCVAEQLLRLLQLLLLRLQLPVSADEHGTAVSTRTSIRIRECDIFSAIFQSVLQLLLLGLQLPV
jgi:hypothetical protein